MEPTTQLQLPGGIGYEPWADIQEKYPKLVKAIQKTSIERYYNHNPVTGQWMCKEEKELRLMELMDFDINTMTLGNNPDAVAAEKVVSKMKQPKTNVYFTNKQQVPPGAVFKDTPDVGETTTVEEFMRLYPETAASFDGQDADSRLDYFFKIHSKKTEDGCVIYMPISKERRIMFCGFLDDEVEEQLAKCEPNAAQLSAQGNCEEDKTLY